MASDEAKDEAVLTLYLGETWASALVTELWGGGGPLVHYEHVHTWVMPILFPAPYHPIVRGFLLGWPIYMLNDAQSKKYLPYLSIFLGTC